MICTVGRIAGQGYDGWFLTVQKVVKEAGSESTRARIPSGCRITFADPKHAELKDIRVETVAPGQEQSNMKAAAARSKNILSGTSQRSGMVLGGAVHKFSPSGTTFDPPVKLRLPLDTELEQELRARGIEAVSYTHLTLPTICSV
eukprot:2581483-Rhodomonas_salina.1